MRPDIHTYYSRMANLVSSRATCIRRQVGCILVNKKNHVLSTGYNGVPSGFDHCTEHKCGGANFPSGEGLNECEAVHAEQNALLQCPNVDKIYAAYTTTAPCITCVKLLLNTSCQVIIFNEDYPHSIDSRRLWEQAGRKWVRYEDSATLS